MPVSGTDPMQVRFPLFLRQVGVHRLADPIFVGTPSYY